MSEVPIFDAPENEVPFFVDPSEEQPAPPPPPSNYTLFWPFMVVLFTLIGSCVRDVMVIRTSNEGTYHEQARLSKLLVNSGTQARSLEALKKDLATLGQNDPIAAQIMVDFSPPAPAAVEHVGPPAPIKPSAK
jgi:hypothetical protein